MTSAGNLENDIWSFVAAHRRRSTSADWQTPLRCGDSDRRLQPGRREAGASTMNILRISINMRRHNISRVGSGKLNRYHAVFRNRRSILWSRRDSRSGSKRRPHHGKACGCDQEQSHLRISSAITALFSYSCSMHKDDMKQRSVSRRRWTRLHRRYYVWREL